MLHFENKFTIIFFHVPTQLSQDNIFCFGFNYYLLYLFIIQFSCNQFYHKWKVLTELVKGHFQNQFMIINFLVFMLISSHGLADIDQSLFRHANDHRPIGLTVRKRKAELQKETDRRLTTLFGMHYFLILKNILLLTTDCQNLFKVITNSVKNIFLTALNQPSMDIFPL